MIWDNYFSTDLLYIAFKILFKGLSVFMVQSCGLNLHINSQEVTSCHDMVQFTAQNGRTLQETLQPTCVILCAVMFSKTN
jgi:hypothetical protein